MDTIYVLMEEGWEYNDEIMFQPEGGGGSPHSFFLKEEEAKAECEKRNLKSFKDLWESGEIRNYCYSFDELIPWKQQKDKEKRKALNTVCEKIFGKSFGEIAEDFYGEVDVPIESHSETDWKELMSHLKLNFWEVVPVEKG